MGMKELVNTATLTLSIWSVLAGKKLINTSHKTRTAVTHRTSRHLECDAAAGFFLHSAIASSYAAFNLPAIASHFYTNTTEPPTGVLGRDNIK